MPQQLRVSESPTVDRVDQQAGEFTRRFYKHSSSSVRRGASRPPILPGLPWLRRQPREQAPTPPRAC